MLGRNNDFSVTGTSAEDQMKINAIKHQGPELTDKMMYQEAARRVVFANCMGECNLDDKSLPNFNKHFYYNMQYSQNCLQDCYNTRMNIHFGPTVVKNEGLMIDFAMLKKEYNRYERWNPAYRTMAEYNQTV